MLDKRELFNHHGVFIEIRTVWMANYCISGLWITLSTLLTITIAFSLLSPVWFQNSEQPSVIHNQSLLHYKYGRETKIICFGMLRFCREDDVEDLIFNCSFYAGIKDMPSLAWVICTVMYAVGTVLMLVAVVMAAVGVCLKEGQATRLRVVIAYVQLFAAGFLGLSILMFPAGLDSTFARRVCGPATNLFASGRCQVAWGYVVAIMSIAMTIFCPILAKYSTEETSRAHSYTGAPTHSKVITTV